MLPKTTPEQRVQFYKDIEDLISPGFLTHPVEIGGVVFNLRSLNPGDLFMIRARVGDKYNLRWQTWVIASSIWMFNGYNLMGEKNVAPRMFQMVERMPLVAHQLLFSLVLGLFARLDRAAEGLEAYMYEPKSRGLWGMLGKNQFQSSHGVWGAEVLGFNHIQRIWRAFNEIEDERLISERQWGGFKLVASSNSPKGVKKIDQADMKSRQEEDSRRQTVMDRYYYYRIGLVDREGFIKGQERDTIGAQITAPKTVEDLESEFTRWVSGEMDEHDRIVEAYKQGILAKRAQEEAEQAARLQRLREEALLRQEADLEPMPLVGYTAHQLEEMLSQKGSGPRGVRKIHDGEFETHRRYVDKFIDQNQQKGNLVVGPDGKVHDPRGDASLHIQSLQELVEKRQVELGHDIPMPGDE